MNEQTKEEQSVTHTIKLSDSEIVDLMGGLDSYIEDLQQFEDYDHSEKIAQLRALYEKIADA